MLKSVAEEQCVSGKEAEGQVVLCPPPERVALVGELPLGGCHDVFRFCLPRATLRKGGVGRKGHVCRRQVASKQGVCTVVEFDGGVCRHKHGVREGGLRQSFRIQMEAAVSPEVVVTVIQVHHSDCASRQGRSDAHRREPVLAASHTLAGIHGFLEHILHPKLLLSRRGDVESQGFSDTAEGALVTKPNQLAVFTCTPGIERGGQSA